MCVKLLLIAAMIALSLINAFLKFEGRWWIFLGVLAWQILAVKEIGAYLFDKDIKFLSGDGVKKDADPYLRKAACGFYFICYFLMYLKE